MYKNDYFVFWYLTCWKFRFLQSFSDFQNLFNLFENIFPLAGNPENRRWGSFGYIGLLTMLGCSIHTSLKFLGIAWFLSKNEQGNLKTTTFKQHPHQSQVFGNCLLFCQFFFKKTIRCHSKSVLAIFYPVTPPKYSVNVYMRFLKLNVNWHFITTYLPTSSCQRSFRMAPDMYMIM